jgi:glyoxylase-like metal-dependent hydrolase (beta-lactamase superfamily II)
MSTEIHPIHVGIDCCYVISSPRGAVVIDGGQPRRDRAFQRGLEDVGVDPRSIGLIIVTHAHWDHFGCLASMRELTDAKVAAHTAAKDRIEAGARVMPPGISAWGRVLDALASAVVPFVKVEPASVDIEIGHAGMSLNAHGIAGRILHTPGHSPGSVSVVLEGGETFVGDLAMSGPPVRRTPGPPIFAENPALLPASWSKLLDAGARMIYPAHGPPFPAELMRSFAV